MLTGACTLNRSNTGLVPFNLMYHNITILLFYITPSEIVFVHADTVRVVPAINPTGFPRDHLGLYLNIILN